MVIGSNCIRSIKASRLRAHAIHSFHPARVLHPPKRYSSFLFSILDSFPEPDPHIEYTETRGEPTGEAA
jgi:hypothetical protein